MFIEKQLLQHVYIVAKMMLKHIYMKNFIEIMLLGTNIAETCL